MVIKNDEYEALVKAVELLPSGDDFNVLSAEEKEIILKADSVLLQLAKRERQRLRSEVKSKNE